VSDATLLLNNDVTHLVAGPMTPSVRAPSVPTSSGSTSQSGWLTSSGSIDHGRFGPGMVLDNRYRVLGLLGRGGMGEVYRADDLRLGQQVALKFLPGDLSRDPIRLAQFHNEVRTARHVSHPNVCRVYDVGEFDGQLFITMEYVDGEDLSILLRRIGRLPEDKGLEIARQICAGLAAAHERGVLHRDLKPANIMLDGAGKVRIMDFSLAAVGEVKDIRAGTPAYMAPEQLGGREVTVRSDIYSLGLVLYEIFTGRRAFEVKTLSELIEQHQSGTITAPTAIVKTLDPAIEAAIVRCLDREPSRRPASAIRVSASLPGGDPLAAALAAGETPSPEMVAAAGGDSAMVSPVAGAIWLAVAVAAVLATSALGGRLSLVGRAAPAKPAAVLADRAEELRQSLGFTEAVADHAAGFAYDDAYLRWAAEQSTGASRWASLPAGRPAALRFWYRTSPRPLLPFVKSNAVNPGDPPLQLHGMTTMSLDTKGRLLRFESAPAQVETAAATPAPHVDWTKLFAAAGLEMAAFAETTPSRTPSTYADERKAWTGTLPETTIPIRIEAAGYRGLPVLYDIVTPWAPAAREPGKSTRQGGNNPIFIYLLLGGAAFAAWRNVRRGRADMPGAFRLAAFTFFLAGRDLDRQPARGRRGRRAAALLHQRRPRAVRRGRALPPVSRPRAVRPPELADDAGGLVADAGRPDPRSADRPRHPGRRGDGRGDRAPQPGRRRAAADARHAPADAPPDRSRSAAEHAQRRPHVPGEHQRRLAERADHRIRVRRAARPLRVADAQRRALERQALEVGRDARDERPDVRTRLHRALHLDIRFHRLHGQRSGRPAADRRGLSGDGHGDHARRVAACRHFRVRGHVRGQFPPAADAADARRKRAVRRRRVGRHRRGDRRGGDGTVDGEGQRIPHP
jgi:serine/threonine-protein kinase